MALFGTTFISGFLMMVISWSILVFNIKKSTRLPEEKVLFYLDNNRVWNEGLTGLMACLVGGLMLVGVLKLHYYPVVSNKFHISGLIFIVFLFGIPGFLLVKIPKWLRKFAERFI